MLSCQVVGEVWVVTPDQVGMLGMFDMGVVEVGGDAAHGGDRDELSDPGSKEER